MMAPGLIDCILIFYRRFLIGAIMDTNFAILAIVITGVEEAIFRCSMVYRDTLLDQAGVATNEETGTEVAPEPLANEEEEGVSFVFGGNDDNGNDDQHEARLEERRRQVWAVSSANAMIYEVVAIIVAHVVYVFRENRYLTPVARRSETHSDIARTRPLLCSSPRA